MEHVVNKYLYKNTHTHTQREGQCSSHYKGCYGQNIVYISKQTSMPSVGFEPTIPAIEQPQTYALDGAANRIGYVTYLLTELMHFFLSPLPSSHLKVGGVHKTCILLSVCHITLIYS
jgi:hypothetical protein